MEARRPVRERARAVAGRSPGRGAGKWRRTGEAGGLPKTGAEAHRPPLAADGSAPPRRAAQGATVMEKIIKAAAAPKLVKKETYAAILDAVTILDTAREQARAILRDAEAR